MKRQNVKDQGIRFIRGSGAKQIVDCLNAFLDGDDQSLRELIRIVNVREEDILYES